MNGKNCLVGLAAAGLLFLSACTGMAVRSPAGAADRPQSVEPAVQVVETAVAPDESQPAQPATVVSPGAQASEEPEMVDLSAPEDLAAPENLGAIHYNCQARDAVTAFLVKKYHLPEPGVWQEQPARQDTPGAQTSLYTSQAWVVKVVAPAAAPFTPEYFIVADHLGQVVRWSGVVKMNGEIVEEEYLQGEPAKQP